MNKLTRNFSNKIIDSIADPVLVIAPDYRVVLQNEAAKRFSKGRPTSPGSGYCYEIAGRDGPCGAAGELCPTDKVLESGKEIKTIRLIYDRAGNKKYYEISASPILEDDGKISGVVEVFRDITALRMAEGLINSKNELQQEYEILQQTFKQVEIAKKEWELTMDRMNDVVILVDEDDRIRRCNSALPALTGKPFTAILGSHWQEFFHDYGFKDNHSYLSNRDVELYDPRTGRAYTRSHYEVADNVLGIRGRVITLHDVTELQEITTELEKKNVIIDENRKILRQALDEISSLILRVVRQKDFEVSFRHPRLVRCWEKMACDRTSCPCYGQNPMRCWQVAGTFCRGETQGQFACKIETCTSCELYQEVVSDPIFEIGEQFNNMMFILKSKNDDLQKVNAELKATQLQILQQEKMASIGQLAAGVAHEINNPIGFVTSNLNSLAKYITGLTDFLAIQQEIIAGRDNPAVLAKMQAEQKKINVAFILTDIKDLLSESLEGVKRVKDIVHNLKSFSRIDQAARAHADLNKCLDDTINIAWNELKYKTTLRKEYGELPQIECYPQQLNQVFLNLLLNATQAIADKGEITVRTWPEEDFVGVSIADTGCGIPAENLSRLFEPFFTTKEVGKGTGLGLSIAYDIITKKHGGRIDVVSQPGHGSTFTIRIPLN